MEATRRLTKINSTFWADGGKKVSMPKTFVVRFGRVEEVSDVSEADIAELAKKRRWVSCEFCDQAFDSGRGMHQHQTGFDQKGRPFCGAAHRPVTDVKFVVESVIDVRGKPGCNRFYLVTWLGGDHMEESTWETEATVRTDGVMSAVDDFWDSRPDLDKSSCCEVDG